MKIQEDTFSFKISDADDWLYFFFKFLSGSFLFRYKADILICHSFVMYGQLSLSSIDEMPVQSLVKTRHETQTSQNFSALSLSLNRKVLIRESNLFFLL
jgi:hypothetical protein